MISVVHLYAKQYGWTREYILDNVFIDEHLLHREIIDESDRNELMIQSNIALLPHLEEKARKEFLENLQPKPNELDKKPKVKAVSFDETKASIEQAKKIMNNI